ncbi:GIY-YIG nuclease family protein [Flectobacillus roseus]|uniref:GIY-YIG nuclease family protein n=1 Tax=Flectobacillus roseus TaxID=502259 RepID=A0ABT6Y328_9BACT|nr:GIY-YIG nuclease family protein [Flectobacillus roseus]MDI9857969.1 GIY-YIG nuclease family protein [Flectobacillus roseus]
MSLFGESIRIYLSDGTVTGIKFGEIVNKTIQSISCPRLRTSELNNYPESKKPGVYFLFGQDEETGDTMVYIGEAENVFNRLQDHIAKKDFWNELVIFISKDENLTKGHIRYLESRLVEIANSTGRYKIENGTQPQLSPLPRPDIGAMEEFLNYIKLLIGVLGHKFLEDITTISKKNFIENVQLERVTYDNQVLLKTSSLELFLNINNIRAKAMQIDEGIVVLKGSQAIKDLKPSMPNGYKELREKLINNGTLVLEVDKYIFKKNAIFDTASPAASVIVGSSISGPQNWRNSEGKTLKTLEQERLQSQD